MLLGACAGATDTTDSDPVCDWSSPTVDVGPEQNLGANPDEWEPLAEGDPLSFEQAPSGGWLGELDVHVTNLPDDPDFEVPTGNVDVDVWHLPTGTQIVDGPAYAVAFVPFELCEAWFPWLTFYPSNPPPGFEDDHSWPTTLDGDPVSLTVTLSELHEETAVVASFTLEELIWTEVEASP